MPIKAGDLAASAPGRSVTVASDGRRMRIIWEEGDGSGDATAHLIERTQNTMKGHPTWKLFCSEVSDPVVRGKSEPPPYLYLDDLACYTVWASQLYTKQELKSMWLFDFDHVGKIKSGRKNRGRPAYSDDSCTEYATGTQRDKKKVYEFCGASDFIGYTPAGLSSRASAGGKEEPFPNITIPKLVTPVIPSLSFPLSPLGSATVNASSTCPLSTGQGNEIGHGRVPWQHAEARPYMAGPVDSSLLPIGMAHKALQGSPYFETPAASYRSRPRPRSGDLAATLEALGVKRKRLCTEKEKEETKMPPVKKRRIVRPSVSNEKKTNKLEGRAEDIGSTAKIVETSKEGE